MASPLGSTLHMPSPHHPQTQRGKWKKWTIPSSSAFTVFLLLLTLLPISSPNPHNPQRLTWQVLSQTGDIVWSTTKEDPLWAWWPPLTPDICALVAGLDNWDIPTLTAEESRRTSPPGPMPSNSESYEYHLLHGHYRGCSYPKARITLSQTPFYVCPRDGRTRTQERQCGGASHFYCAAWDCETTGNTYWNPTSSWDLIRVQKNLIAASCYHQGWCNPLNVSFTEKGRQSREWIKGKTWGLRFYVPGYDDGFSFTIKLKVETLTAVQVGPNLVISEQRPPTAHLRPPAPQTSLNGSTTVPTSPTLEILSTGQRLLNLIQGAFSVLNASNPNLTKSCWLCLVSSPPYYEGIAFSGTFNNTTSHDSCSWGLNNKLTLTEVSGSGTCLGSVPTGRKHLCNQTIESPQTTTNYYLVPPVGGWWACSTGITPCVSSSVFNTTKDYCVLIQLVPRVIYHEAGSFEAEFDLRPRRQKREPISLTLAVLLGLGVAAGVGTGTTALIQTPQYIEGLRAAVDEDLKAIEQSITKLEESLTSLSEVVLQNRRGLDLLFLKDGGLCAALKEECCFYIDHSGVIKDSMSKLRERLETRQRDREAHQGWFESWYSRSPWLTTLISTLMGPLIILLLILTFGPCILNRLVTFIRERISAVQVLMLRQQYQSLRQGDSLGGGYIETEVP